MTCDELLLNHPSPTEPQCSHSPSAPAPSISTVLLQYKFRSRLTVGIAAVGTSTAILFNFVLSQPYIGFFAAAVLSLVSIFCQAAAVGGALLSLSEADTPHVRWSVIRQAELSFSLAASLLCITLPFALLPPDASSALGVLPWLLYSTVFLAIALLSSAAVCYLVNLALSRRWHFPRFHVLTHSRGLYASLQLVVLVSLGHGWLITGQLLPSPLLFWLGGSILCLLHMVCLARTCRSPFAEDRGHLPDTLLYVFSGFLLSAALPIWIREYGFLPDPDTIANMLQYDVDDGLAWLFASFGAITVFSGLLSSILLTSTCVALGREAAEMHL